MSASHSWLARALGAWLLATSMGAFAPAVRGGAMSIASAQDGGTTSNRGGAIAVNPISVGDEDVNTLEDIVRLGIDDCLTDAAVIFDLDGVPASKGSIDVYVGDACNRTDRNNTDANRCTHIAMQSTNGQTRDLRIELRAQQLFEACDDGMEAERTIWFLAVDDPQGAEDVGTGYGSLRIDIDGDAPNPPSDVEGGSGEREIDVDWNTNEANLEGFLIYVDSTTGDGGAGSASIDDDGGAASDVDCGSGRLRPGSAAPDPDDFETVIEVNESTATGETLGPDDIPGGSAAVAVVAIDEAGNRSVLSELACVSVEPTQSFWDRYQDMGGAAQEGCPCNSLGAVHAHSAWPVALALLALRRSARRRRRS